MQHTLFLDTETFSETPLKTAGTYRYADDAEVMLVSLAWDDEPAEVWDLTPGGAEEGWLPALQSLIDRAAKVVIQNSTFDRRVLRHNGITVPTSKIEDTIVIARQHALPGDLDKLCGLLGVPEGLSKDKDGKRLIQLFTKPRPKRQKLRRATRETHPDDWQKFIEYARLDVDAMRAVHARLPRWNCNASERGLWLLDQDINDRGFAVDLDLAQSALRAFERVGRSLADAAAGLTDGAVTSTTKRDRLLSYLRDEQGFELFDLQKGTVASILRGEGVPAKVRKLLENRQEASKASTAKYAALLKATSADGRLRGTIQFCGASRTGRDAGRIFQPQNLPRTPDWFDEAAQAATIQAFKSDCEDILYDDVADRCSYAIRGSLIAEQGNKLVIADLSNIEGRVLAWMAEEEWKLAAFKAYDRGEGPDLYKVTAGRILGKPPAEVTKEERQNQGKVPELAGGYQGSVGAYRTMGGLVFDAMDDDAILVIVRAWRAAHPRTVSLWYDAERAAKMALRNPGDSFSAGPLTFHVKHHLGRPWLTMSLPSGRLLCYPFAHFEREDCVTCGATGSITDNGVPIVCPSCGGDGFVESGAIAYEGVHQYTRQWVVLTTYGGKLCIAAGTPVLTDAGWLPIEQVTPQHRVWDGIEWVTNDGLDCKGVTGVINVSGVWMTPDHEVLTAGGWVRASQSEGLERADPRIPDGYALSGERRQALAVGTGVRVRGAGGTGRQRDNEAAEAGGTGFLRVSAKADHGAAAHHPRHVEAQGFRRVAEHAGSLQAAYAPILGQLRRAWDSGLRILAALFCRFLGRYGADVSGGVDAGAPRQFFRVLAGELRMGLSPTSGPEQARKRHDRHAVGVHHRSGSSGPGGPEQVHGVLPRGYGSADQSLAGDTRQLAEVYDLVNCGPRQRFVVAGENGEAFTVHNCENATQAAARDVFFHGLRHAMAAGYGVVLRVHDELVCEVPDRPDYSSDGLAEIMSQNPPWAVGLPLAAAGFEAHRYRKD